MKTLFKISSRYLLAAALMLLLTLVLNVFMYLVFGFQIVRSTQHTTAHIRLAADELGMTDGQITLSDSGYDYLEQHFAWAMLLNDQGQVIWSWELPPQLDHPYTSREIAVFSKWYLDDYPVTEQITDYGLFITAKERHTVWKQNFSDSVGTIEFIIRMIPVTLGANFFLVFLMVFFLAFRFHHSLRVLENGIQNLSEQKPIRLPEKGTTEILARQLNRTSDMLTLQREHLQRRDDARASWIRGVSHDIRTPLSLIMGYAADMKEDPALSESQRMLAERIKAQSLQIRRLIEDLNLTSRLEYDMQPLRLTILKPSELLRTVVSGFYNQGLTGQHAIDLYIDRNVEQLTLNADRSLLARAFTNLIGNSIRHNPGGCTVMVTAYPDDGGICFQISDNGSGIPDRILRFLTDPEPDAEKAPHILGLQIARQIFRAHGWEMVFTDANTIHILAKL